MGDSSFTTFLLIFGQLIAVTTQLAVPPEHCPEMCICDHVEKFVMCQDKKLAHVPMSLPNGTKLLGLSKNIFTHLTPNMFDKTGVSASLESVVLYDNRIQDIEPMSFSGLDNVHSIWLFGNYLKTLAANAFVGLPSLTLLDLSRNIISDISQGAFNGLNSIQAMHLWGNNLTTIDENAFQGLENLNNLTLGDNMIEEIPTRSFKHLKNLTTLEVLNLPIRNIPRRAFSGLTNLRRLHIGDWPLLESIADDAFVGLDKLTYISLHRCRLYNVPSVPLSALTGLKHLMLSSNPLSKLEDDDFANLENLEELYVSNANLKFMHENPFYRQKNLKTLDLSQNTIETLPSHIFLQQESLKFLNLSHNEIKTLPSTVFAPLVMLNEVDLRSNSLICDCNMKWLKSLQEIKIRSQFTLMGQCSNPMAYNGTDIVALPPRAFRCEPPYFREENLNVTMEVQQFHKATLKCIPDKGIPQPVITWTLPDKSSIRGKTQLPDGSLYITAVNIADYGHYSCVATNEHGSANRTVVLVEHIPPPAEDGGGSGNGAAIAIPIVSVSAIALVGYYVFKQRGGSIMGMLSGGGGGEGLKRSYKSM